MSGEWISPLNRSTAHINGTLTETSFFDIEFCATLFEVPESDYKRKMLFLFQFQDPYNTIVLEK